MNIENKIIFTGVAEKREAYEAPILEMVEVRVEHGFQQSLTNPDSGVENDDPTW